MTEYQEKAIRAIEAQQAKTQECSPQWMVGEQLKDICRMEPHSAELIAQDLDVAAMSIIEAEKQIKGYSDEHKGKGAACFCVSPAVAERILREFYGLPAAGAQEPASAPEQAGDKVLRLEDFFG